MVACSFPVEIVLLVFRINELYLHDLSIWIGDEFPVRLDDAERTDLSDCPVRTGYFYISDEFLMQDFHIGLFVHFASHRFFDSLSFFHSSSRRHPASFWVIHQDHLAVIKTEGMDSLHHGVSYILLRIRFPIDEIVCLSNMIGNLRSYFHPETISQRLFSL